MCESDEHARQQAFQQKMSEDNTSYADASSLYAYCIMLLAVECRLHVKLNKDSPSDMIHSEN